jgi:Ca-activated chloride channel family protein
MSRFLHRRFKQICEGVSLWLAVLLMLFVHPLYAEANEADNVGQLHFVDGQGQWQEPALVLDSEFDIQVSGLIADTRLLRSFRNTSDQWREGVFVFPLPEKASVYGLTMKVGERTIEGKVQPKETARQTYEKAKQAGQHAALVPGENATMVLPRDLVFVIDTSGSMAGASIRQARRALQAGLATLTPRDRFNVIQFNSQTHSLFMQPEVATGNKLARARRYVDRLRADGGTEMAPALSRALESVSETEEGARVRQVIFITDGAVGNEAALFRQIRQQLGSQRLFTVGIGSAPNRHFMREAARWGRGTYTAIQSPSDLDGPLQALFSAMESPVLTDIRVDWPGQETGKESFPRRPGDLFQGEPLIHVVRGVPAMGKLTASGRLPGGKDWIRTLDMQQAASATGLHRHWAREKIDSLEDEAKVAGRKPDKAGITELAVSHGLMSTYTSFVAVDTTPARNAETPMVSDNLTTLLPAGSQAGMLRYPRTATAAPLLIALGLVGLLFSLAIVLLQRRVFA